jgi:hypothetical protein
MAIYSRAALVGFCVAMTASSLTTAASRSTSNMHRQQGVACDGDGKKKSLAEAQCDGDGKKKSLAEAQCDGDGKKQSSAEPQCDGDGKKQSSAEPQCDGDGKKQSRTLG